MLVATMKGPCEAAMRLSREIKQPPDTVAMLSKPG